VKVIAPPVGAGAAVQCRGAAGSGTPGSPRVQRLMAKAQGPPTTPAKAADQIPLTRVASKDGTIEGTVKLEGIKLVQGRLLFRIPKTFKTPTFQFKADILSSTPVVLRQAQTVLNNMRLTLQEIEDTLQHTQLQHSREQLLHVMSRLLRKSV
jgi:hypothetical protein